MEIFIEISIVLVIATAVAAIMRLLKQPLVMGHILTGIIVGPGILNIFLHGHDAEVFSQIGIATLLFIVGLSLSPKVVREVGITSLVTGLGQIIFTSVIGWGISMFLGYTLVQSLYIAIALTFSSTIIILKLLSDKRDLEKLYGRISVGFLLVQDLAAVLILVIVSSLSSGGDALSLLVTVFAKGIAITLLLFLISWKVLPKLSDFFAKSQEYLFLFSIGWGLGLATLFTYIGFSLEIGALIAGITLSISPYANEIGARLKPLRDFFLIMFFILLGYTLQLDSLGALITDSLVFSFFVLIGNPLIVMILLGLLRYNKRTGFLSGLTVAQISEFSLVVVLMGVRLGHVSQEILSLVTLVGIITISASTYMIIYAEHLYTKIAGWLTIFERKQVIAETDILSHYKVVLFGGNRIGYDFIEVFKELGQSFMVIDFDPQVISELGGSNINSRYGDAQDVEFLEELNLEKSEMVISTIPDFDTNKVLIEYVGHKSPESVLILISQTIEDALRLYEAGADYVVLPHFIGGHYASNIAKNHGFSKESFQGEKEKHVKYLEERKSLGHEKSSKKFNYRW